MSEGNIDPKTINWRILLVHYTAHVWSEEGAPFIPYACDGFAEEEIVVLTQIEDEARKVVKT